MESMIDETSVFLKENDVEYLFVFDKSGTCAGLENITSLAYSKLIEKEKHNGFPTKVSTVWFDSLVTSIKELKNDRIKDGHTPARTVVAIMTDGLDNYSRIYDIEEAKSTVLECQREGWEFIFIGNLKNANEIASQLGITIAFESQNNVEGITANFDKHNSLNPQDEIYLDKLLEIMNNAKVWNVNLLFWNMLFFVTSVVGIPWFFDLLVDGKLFEDDVFNLNCLLALFSGFKFFQYSTNRDPNLSTEDLNDEYEARLAYYQLLKGNINFSEYYGQKLSK